ncbi:immunity 26/phosphotriesterase HocA family protein [Mucilaginibacter sp. RS28]|uniref:Immunity 26/phosphotriesterase HocA family protein n=1 Tax=Mucilaginibacter straminoryzae TaxID=2932774 RepID=A0A9X2BDG5_9SPHI|nr:immunity 26/phosphotriesterase HocA family protein [Mucilaginibacter straminoryzae]MCJ8212057.1 immunity 26/phosphotriesterase HocA family protein [Mucilaginibacter straminoryzae]
MEFELTNEQRIYFGLEPIEPHWDRVILNGDTYRQASILYYDGDIIKRHIVWTKDLYQEKQYDDLTRDRTILLPKTGKGKEKKLTASVLESRQPTGVYVSIDSTGRVFIGNYHTQTTFYDSSWEKKYIKDAPLESISNVITEYIETASDGYLGDIKEFKQAQRKLVKFKSGDFFAFKLSRTQYGFGRVLVNIDLLKKKNIISKDHGLNVIMTKPVLVKIYAYISDSKNVDIEVLQQAGALPSDYMMDNLLLYGQFEIFSYKDLESDELDFPMSYGRNIDFKKHASFIQWGLIYEKLPTATFNKYFVADNPFVAESSPSRKISNPYGYYGLGFYPKYSSAAEIKDTIANNGQYDFVKNSGYYTRFDLRNPVNKEVREEIMVAFGLNPNKGYDENCHLMNTADSYALLTLTK